MRQETESARVKIWPHELDVSPAHVARYAGGANYSPDSLHWNLIEPILELARQLVAPVFVYSILDVEESNGGGYIRLAGGSSFPFPAGELNSCVKSLAFCVCTIGGRLEEKVQILMSEGNSIEGMFLDAAGVAFLEELSTRAWEYMKRGAEARHLHSGSRISPGCGDLDLSVQKQIIKLVDAASIGVLLNESCMMIPAKSSSFLTEWTTSYRSDSTRPKCSSCGLTNCNYRV
jgi:hypothetical protein